MGLGLPTGRIFTEQMNGTMKTAYENERLVISIEFTQ